jgi:hypothetical protein
MICMHSGTQILEITNWAVRWAVAFAELILQFGSAYYSKTRRKRQHTKAPLLTKGGGGRFGRRGGSLAPGRPGPLMDGRTRTGTSQLVMIGDLTGRPGKTRDHMCSGLTLTIGAPRSGLGQCLSARGGRDRASHLSRTPAAVAIRGLSPRRSHPVSIGGVRLRSAGLYELAGNWCVSIFRSQAAGLRSLKTYQLRV